jgi:prolyl-tRNA synthetase
MSKLPDIKQQFSEWYHEVIAQAELADQSPVRGCMVIRPYGYALWEHIRNRLDERIKQTGHENASFPLFIPESFIKKEAEHVQGFAPELAIVTHAGGKELEEPLVVRPTSETIVHYMFARWLTSWRDLPIKINQWANVVRWEMRTRPFLRTTEFFWQEGHTAHETREQAQEEAELMLNEYIDLAHNYLAIPVIAGVKSETEKFPGADVTYTYEALMQDGKALQMGTSHIISQQFARSFNMMYQDRAGNQAYPYLTSWGATTRLIGAVIMVHGDAKGLILPPKIAPVQVVIIPIFKRDFDNERIRNVAQDIKKSLEAHQVRVLLDEDEHKTPGSKFFKWELKGVPLRIEVGPRDLAEGHVMMVDRLGLTKQTVVLSNVVSTAQQCLESIQKALFVRAQERLQSQRRSVAKLHEFGPELVEHNGLIQTGWCQQASCEKMLKEFGASTRCLLPIKTFESCFHCQEPSLQDVLVARAY